MFDWLAHKYFIWKKPSSMYLKNVYYVGFKNGISAMFMKYNSFIYSIKYACKSTYHYQISYTWWINRHMNNIMSLYIAYYIYYLSNHVSVVRENPYLGSKELTLYIRILHCSCSALNITSRTRDTGERLRVFFMLTFRHNSKVGSDRIHGAVKGAQIVNK